MQRFASSLHDVPPTLVIITKVMDYLVQILQGEGLEDLLLALWIIGDVTEWEGDT